MATVVIQDSSKAALRGASAAVKEMAADIWNADPDQIEAGINARITDLATAKQLLTVLTLAGKNHEQRLRTLEEQVARLRDMMR